MLINRECECMVYGSQFFCKSKIFLKNKSYFKILPTEDTN